jgi:hypothetical protein
MELALSVAATLAHVVTASGVQSKSKSIPQWADFYLQALDRIRIIPGVQAAGIVDNFSFSF